MKSVKFYAGEALRWVCESISDAGEKVYAMHRPTAKGTQMNDMIVVSFASELADQGSFQNGTLRIDLISRDKGDGISNVKRLQEMCDAVVSKFPLVKGKFKAVSPKLIVKGSDGEGFSVWVVYASIQVNTSERLEYGG